MRIQRLREKAQNRSFILPPMPPGGIDYLNRQAVRRRPLNIGRVRDEVHNGWANCSSDNRGSQPQRTSLAIEAEFFWA